MTSEKSEREVQGIREEGKKSGEKALFGGGVGCGPSRPEGKLE